MLSGSQNIVINTGMAGANVLMAMETGVAAAMSGTGAADVAADGALDAVQNSTCDGVSSFVMDDASTDSILDMPTRQPSMAAFFSSDGGCVVGAGGGVLLGGGGENGGSGRAGGGGKKRMPEDEIAEVLDRHKGDRRAAAEELGILKVSLVNRIHRAGPLSPLAKFKIPQPAKIPDEVVAAALQRHKGDRVKAAKEIGLSMGTLLGRISGASGDSPLTKFIKPRRKIPRKISDEQMAELIERHGGNQAEVARELGVSSSCINHRVHSEGEGSPLSKYRGRRGPKGISNDVIAAAMEKCGGNGLRAVVDIGMSYGRLQIRVRRSPEGSPLARFRDGFRQYMKVSDAVLAAALEKSGGSQNAASKSVGLAQSAVNRRVRSAGPDSPLARFQKPPLKRLAATDAEIAAVLEENGGATTATAGHFGVSDNCIRRHILRVRKGSPLFCYREKWAGKTRVGRPPRVSAEALAEALAQTRGNRSAAGRIAGISTADVCQRIFAARSGSPLAKFRGVKYKFKSEPLVSDEVLAVELHRAGGDRNLAALAVNLSPETIYSRARDAGGDSPLKRFHRARRRVSDEKIAAVLERHSGDADAAAADLNLASGTVSNRIARAPEDSPLAKFGRVPEIADDALAAVLGRHGGNRKAAAAEAGLTYARVSMRIAFAAPDSPLAGFKPIRPSAGK